MKVAILLSAKDIGFEATSEDELRATISSLSIIEVAPFLGRLLTALQLQPEQDDLQRACAEQLLSPPVREQLYARGHEELRQGRQVFWVVPAQLRVLLKLLFESAAGVGGMGVGDPEASRNIGAAILSIQPTFREAVDLGPRPRGSKAHLYDFLELRHSAIVPTARPYATLSHKEGVYKRIFSKGDLRERFRFEYGADPLDVHRGLMSLWIAFSRNDADLLRVSSEHLVDHRMLFGRFEVPRSAGNLILSRLGRDLRKAPQMPPPMKGVPWSSDLGFLVERPLGIFDENFVCCLDFEFLRSAFARLLHNLTTGMLGKDEANRLVNQEGGRLLEEESEVAFDAFRTERPRLARKYGRTTSSAEMRPNWTAS